MDKNITRAWKDSDYRNSLSAEEQAAIPENPAGDINVTDLTEQELDNVQGGTLFYYSDFRVAYFSASYTCCDIIFLSVSCVVA